MVKITYEYRGLKAVPDKKSAMEYLDEEEGNYVRGHFEVVWYEGSEECSKRKLKNRLNVLEHTTNAYGEKIYRNIQVVKE